MAWTAKVKIWRARGAETVAALSRFLNLQTEPVRYLEDEVRGLVAPCLPLLVRKRIKFFSAMGSSAPERRHAARAESRFSNSCGTSSGFTERS